MGSFHCVWNGGANTTTVNMSGTVVVVIVILCLLPLSLPLFSSLSLLPLSSLYVKRFKPTVSHFICFVLFILMELSSNFVAILN